MTGIQRNLANAGGSLYVNRFLVGLITQRSPLFVPLSAMGLQIIAMHDALWDGLNTEISRTMTLQRRPGYPRFCTQQFGASDYPLAFYSFKKLDGTIYPIVDTPTSVYHFNGTTLTLITAKAAAAQMRFQSVANVQYMCNGTDAKKWDGTTVSGWGIAFPVTAPTVSPGAGSLSPTSGYKWGYVYKNSTSGHISTMSPASANPGPGTSRQYTISGTGSADAQVNFIDIYRTLDGGSIYYFVASIANPGAVAFNYVDNNADTALNDALVAPVSHSNDPPPAGIKLCVMHGGRMWVATGNNVYFGGGPDVTNGVPEEAFPPANVFAFPGDVTAMASTSIGMIVWTADDAYVILGSDLASFYSQKWQANFGVQNQNCVVQDGDQLFAFTSRGQLFSIGSDLAEVGFNIRAKLGAFNPATVRLALHRSGDDEGLFVGDGVANVYRYSIALGCWSPVATPAGGVGSIASIETSTAVYTLVAGRTAGLGYILGRSTATFQDDGASYHAWATAGSLVLSPPGQAAMVESVMCECSATGSYPTVSILPNEVSGAFTVLSGPVPDPPTLPASTTVLTKRHYLKAAQTPIPQKVRHLQVKFDFGTEATKQELYGFAIA